tara:strand:- start:218 stop:403 length:186 start_codon:yes stop_codon:yes gene_type:complete
MAIGIRTAIHPGENLGLSRGGIIQPIYTGFSLKSVPADVALAPKAKLSYEDERPEDRKKHT